MRHILIIISSILLSVSCGYSQEIKKEFYDNGSLKNEYKSVNGKPDGAVKFYYESGELQGSLNYSNGMQNGPSTIYHKNGKIFKSMTFKNGEQDDTMKIYYESGQLQEISFIHNGKKEGIYMLYYENGQLQIKGMTKDFQLHGHCEHYLENGKLEKKGEYYLGQPVGTWMEYNEIGVTQKNYKQISNSKVGKDSTLETFSTDDFSVKYPNSWNEKPTTNSTIKFACIPSSAEGIFKENITIIVQPTDEEFKTLDPFVDYANSYLKNKYKDFKIITDKSGNNESFKYRDVFYNMKKDLGKSSILLKVWTRYFIVNKNSYQITFTCEEENYDERIDETKKIVDSFKLK